MWKKFQLYLQDVKTELKKVTFPTKKETISGTTAVIIAVIIISIFLGIVDFGLSKIVEKLLKIGL